MTPVRRVLVALFASVDARDWLYLVGLLLIHLGLRSLELWAPGASWYGPGLILVANATFGFRGGAAVPKRPPQRGA